MKIATYDKVDANATAEMRELRRAVSFAAAEAALMRSEGRNPKTLHEVLDNIRKNRNDTTVNLVARHAHLIQFDPSTGRCTEAPDAFSILWNQEKLRMQHEEKTRTGAKKTATVTPRRVKTTVKSK